MGAGGGGGGAEGPAGRRGGGRRGARSGSCVKSELSRPGLSALQRGHTPRGFPSGTSRPGWLLLRCHAGLSLGQPPGARLSPFPRAGDPPGTPGTGLQNRPGGSAPDPTPVGRREVRGGCGVPVPALVLKTFTITFSSSREDIIIIIIILGGVLLDLFFFFPSKDCVLQAPDPGGERSPPRLHTPPRAGDRMLTGFPRRWQPDSPLPR